MPSNHAPEFSEAVSGYQQGVLKQVLLLLAAKEHLVLACFDPSQIILDQGVKRHSVVAQESRVHLSL